ncbi:MAG: alpha/beta hydrolase [Sporichthyaceae bacterium]
MAIARPEFDPELKAGLAVVGGVFPPTVTPDLIPHLREISPHIGAPTPEELRERRIVRVDYTVPGYNGQDIEVSVLRSEQAAGLRPGVVHMHAGGMIVGGRFSGFTSVLDWIDVLGAVVVTVEYRLAPEFPDPCPREDSDAALEWVAKESDRLGIRRDRILISGTSAGGGIAAGIALAARDRGGPELCGQVLSCPMLDDRGTTPSTYQFDRVGIWDRFSNETGWTALLGADYRGPDVSPYAAPARAVDLSNLPRAYLDVGSAEIFRDEVIAYAGAMWRDGSDAELHVWAGAFHVCDFFAPHAAVSREMMRTRNAWVAKVLED